MKSRNVEDVYPLSPAQEGILFHSLYEPESGFYVKQMSCPLHGPIDLAALERAWQRVVERHTILRTSFVWKKQKRSLQVVHREVSVPFAVHDWRGRPGRWEAFLEEDLKQGFDASRPPLMRLALARTDEDTHQLLWTAHHLLVDGWSLPLVLGEVFQLYTAFQAGQDVALPPPRPYGDFVAWLQRQDLARAEAFWKERLRAFPAPTPLPGRWASNGHGAGPLGVRRARLGAEATAALQSLAQRNRLTLSTLVQGAWGILLGRYADQPDVVFGIAVSGRPTELPDAGAMVGPFLNTVPVRLRAAEDEPLPAWLAGLQRQVLEIQAYEHSPLVLVQGWSEVPRGTALFESLLVFENYPAEAVPAQGNGALRIGGLSTLERTNYPLTLSVVPGEELAFRLAWDAGRFDGDSAGRLLEHLLRILEGMASASRLSDLSLPVGDEAAWNESAREVPAVCAHTLVERRAALHPGSAAVNHGDETVTYAELELRATALARRLCAVGVGPESLVGLAVERSPAMLASMLAVWKSGAAYLPLDLAQPRERLAMILEDAPPAVVVTEEALLGSLPPHGARVLVLDREEGPVSAEPLPAAHLDNLAYVLFTSGSTGRPKGVQISHRALVNFLVSMREEPGLRETDLLLAVTTLSFDIAALELILPLTVGAQVAIAGREEAADGARLLERLSGATVLQATPATWRMLLDAGWSGDAGLRAFCGGEALPAPLAARLLPRVAELWNLYGPTETTVWSAVRRVGPGEDEPASVAVGRPVANTRLHLLGRDGRPVPLEAAGELWIGGAGLARGYRGLPALTADRFRPDPFGEAGGRLYRTGDLARRLPDGRIEFLGRLDHQVKIRGFRIELGEIEAALEAHPEVRQAVVVARETSPGERSLVAYVTGAERQPARLRAFLHERLPDFMVPSRFVALEALPLTASGKVDRRALPAPDEAAESVGSAAPRDPVEEILAGLWRELLGREAIGIHDDFFELGGHSLMATQLAAKLWQAFGVELPVRRLFEAPTVARLAEVVRAARRKGGDDAPPPLVPIVPIPRDAELPLSFAQAREWFLDRLEPGSAAYDIPCTLRLRGRLRIAAARRALDEIVGRHESLRTVFPSRDGRPVQVISPSLDFEWPLVDLGGLPEAERQDEARKLAADHAAHSFDLARGPLLLATFLRLADEEHLLLINVHHIVADDWSLGVLVGELGTLYSDFTSGRPASLPPLPVQYADFAVWQRARLQGSALEVQLAYWRSQLGGDRPPLALLADRPRPALRSFRGAEVPVVLRAQVAELAAGAGASVFMAVLAAFQALLHRWTGERDVSVGTFVANRDRAEVEPLIGFFVNTLVLRSRPATGTAFGDFLKAVRETCLDAYAHRDVPFERVLEDLQPERHPGHAPLFQVMLVFQNAPAPAVELPGLEMETLHVETARSDFDLTLWMWQGLDGRLEGTLNYATDLFHRTTALRMVKQLQRLIAGAISDPGRTLGELPLLAEAERHQVLLGWNDTAVNGDPPEPVHRLVSAVARTTPGAVAVVAGTESLTYGELEARSSRLARRLRRLGVGPESRVALCVERSLDMVVGLLAVLKSGGAYVPLDPAYPRERRDLLLADSGAVVVLGPGLIEAAEEKGSAPEDLASPASLAYVIYTSGSTGRPKGVLVPHGALAAHTRAAVAHHGIRPGDRVLQFASISFDASAEEIYPCLAAGATLVLRDESMLGSPARFAEACRDLGITVLDLPTAFWHELVGIRLPESVRLVILGGEKALAERWAQWHESGATARLVNTYGPTEATIVATLAELGQPGGEAPIGRPISGVRAHVLDAGGLPQPMGVPGELCLGGMGVARGYLGDPAATAARFVPDPFGEGTRLYRTGDLARWRGDGELEFLGRIDTQVKIRGFRVEPGEIEAALAAHPGVREAAVVARESRLVAYAVPADPAPSSRELRAWLEARLPRHLVPSAFMLLESLPRTAAGKIDRRGLPAPEVEEGDHTPAASPTEEMLSTIWAEVLGAERVGARDNFFDLGGHSLVATQIVARIQELFQVDLPLRELFEAPTVEQLALRVEEAGRREVPPLRRVPRDRDLPLSFSQERIWFLSRLDPESTSYFVPRALRLTGRLDVAALERAYAALLERHEVLRTSFPEVDGRPVQRIHPAAPFRLPLVDLRGLPDGPRQREEERLILEDGARLFDVEAGPLIRASLLQAAEEEWVAVQTEHHLVHDGWTEAVLLRDLLGLYQAFAERREPGLPELPVQFADFAVWQREWLRGEVLEEQLAWWRERLAGAPPLLELPADRPRPPRPSFRGEAEDVLIPRDLVRQLRALGRREGATLFMTVLAAFETLLLRLTGQEDLVVGTGVANRRQRETEGMLGMVINTLALRTDASGDPPFAELLRRVRETCLGAYAHQDLPFDRLVEALRPERTPSHAPVFQVLFAFHDARFPEVALPGLDVRSVMRHNRSAKFDLVLILTPYDEGDGSPAAGALGVHAEYSTDLFDAATARRFLDGLQRLLAGAVADPAARLSDLPLLTSAQRDQILVEWNDTARDYPSERTIHGLFEEVATRRPDAVALVSGDRETTYGELNALADRLAVRLRSHGVGPEVPVAILAERSPEMVVALLAILKTGGLYMPLAANQPAERLVWLLADAAPRVVLVQEGLEARLAAFPAGIQPLPLGREPRQPAEGAAGSGALPAEAGPDNLAYILYTSGSTGRPKGVAVPHRAVLRLVRGTGYADFSPERVWGQLAPVPFDASTLEIWGPLLNGAKLVIFPAGPMSIAELGALVARHGIDSLWLTAGLFHQVVEEEPEALRPLRQLLAGGDVLSPEHVRKALAGNPGLRLLNGYGPTENTTFTCCHGLSDPGEVGWTVPLGPPIANTRVYVLDGDRQPVPVGVAGELCAGGDGLARGYLGRPDLTAERFVPDPHGAPGSRVYRTGDRARFRPDGTVEFLGRMDRQVKLRGFRIEPAEIEAVLATHSGVSSCAVVVREGRHGDRRLVAYWTAREGAGEAGLAAFLRERLPDYMVPSAFVLLDELPLTRNGKVDRGALPAPGLPSRAPVAPRTPCEELLGRLWSDLLGCAQVGVDDDFFELGGHSLLVTQLVSRIRAAFGVELPLKAVFESPTLGSLADSVERAMRSRAIPASPPILPRRRTPEGEASLPLSFAQQRLWFLEQLEPGSAFYNIPAAIRIRGPLEVAPFMAALQEIVRRHESLRTTFVEREGSPVQAISPSLALPVPVADLRALPEPQREETIRGLATDDARRPFDLARGPLIRTLLLQSAPDEHVLLINQHHIVSDGWSTGVLARELMALYRAFSTAGPCPLPPLPVQYADFTLWQRDWLQGDVLAEQLDYWRARLQGVTGLELPLDRPRPPVETFRGSYHSFPLSRDLSERLRGLARSRGVSLFMVLLASFKALLLRVTGQSDIPVGSPIANRNRREVEDLIGFFANTLVMRAELDAGTPFEELLARVREVTLGGYAHQELPFERLVEELQPERDMSRNPLFQVMCVLQNQPFPSVEGGGVTWSRIPIDSGTAKFDLTFFWYEDDGRISGALEYNTDLFDPSTALRLVRYQESLLQAAVESPGSSLIGLPLLGEAQRHQLLAEWNATGVEEAELACVHRWVEAQVERTPDAVALLYRGRGLTYREINGRANRLAHLLRRRGVGPESLVGICVERSAPMVVALLAVLKAGGAGVALDPAYPHERLATIIADAGMRVLLTQESLLAHFPGTEDIALCLDDEEALCAGESGRNPESGVDLDNPIYAIYTSGSTGQPKGIVVTHRAFANLLDWQLARSPLAGRARTVQFATFGFCVSFQEIFSAWCSGAALVLADEVTRRDVAGLGTFLEEERIERLHLPFAALKHLAEAAATLDRLPGCLREVITAGEQLQVNPAVRRLFAHLPGCSLHNQYGASETHVVTALTLDGEPGGWPAIPSVGRPVSNVRIHLLDSALAPVPIGVPGELYAGGACVARGYLNDPVLTARKMVPDPFSPVPGARLYRTGDSARHLADGSIEYHGRIDTQVKIRGFRVELGEIDTVLASHPAVRDAAVVARAVRSGDRRLVAYLVLDDPRPQVLDDLRALLKSRLPEHMLPAAYVELDALPLNANGKLDQAALPVPEPQRTGERTATAPRNVVEEVLAGIWAEVLDVPPGSIRSDDNFFELGGHSLLATRAASRLRGAFQVDLPLRELFENPTVARLAARIEEEQRNARKLQAPPFRKVAPEGEAPLSFAQQRLWFLDQLEPGSPVYHVPFALGVSGPLDLGVLERALGEVVRRHEVLRTVFHLRREEPVQVVQPFAGLPIRRVDLSGLPAEARGREAARLAAEEARAPFSLSTGPLLRVSALHLRPGEHAILLTLHHVVCDEWSLGILVRELSLLYAAFLEGRPSPIPELPFQYLDFSEWQRLWLSGGTLEVHLAYWRARLDGAPVLELPADRPRPPVLSLRGALLPMSLPAGLSAGLRALAQGSGATLFMTLLAAFEVLLHRHSGQRDLVLGTDVANRSRRETEGMIGFFVNQLVLRTRLAPAATFRELLRQVKDVVLEAHLHQDLPFAKLVEELRVERDLSRNPLFQTTFALHLPDGAPDFPGLSLSPWPLPAGTAKFDLTLAFTDFPEGLAGGFEYSTDLFDAATIGRMAAHLEVLIRGIVADPDSSLPDLALLGEAERHQILAEWNDSATDAPESTFSGIFEAQAARTPGRAAVVCGGESLTYRELDERAGRAAGFLAEQGVGPDTVVALLAERGIDFLVAVLAVFKAGGAYLPLDPYHPAARHARILERSGCRLVLAEKGFLPALEPAGGARLFDLGEVARAERPPVSGRQLPRHLAYVIYTSGSTGEPKGVMIEQRGMVNHLRAKLSALGLGPDDAVAQNASQCFDISVWQLLAALMVGGRVQIVPDEIALDAAELLRLLERERITVFETVPSMLRALLDRLETRPADLSRLRWLIPTGEALPPDLCRRWLGLYPGTPLLNAYGPTECSDDVTHHEVSRAPEGASVPIGRPVSNLAIHLLDREGSPVPAGVAGELFVAGAGLGRGYLGDPALTAAAFVPDPVSGEPGARLYRSGDLARRLGDGTLEFLGRIDHQVKVRGFRIELGEVEAALARHPEVREAVVVARDEPSGDRRLVAYVVPRTGEADAALAARLREDLAASLPDYMVPAAAVVLDALPLTPNGKVDRRALPEPDRERPELRESYVAPRDEVEERLAGIWREILGVDRVGVRDSFFDLGGHSLLATQVLSRVRDAFHREISLREIFDQPTVAHLAGLIKASGGESPSAEAPRLERAARDRYRTRRTALDESA